MIAQRKVTEYLGKILVDKYGVAPRIQTEENAKNWELAVQYDQLFFEYCEELRKSGKNGAQYETRKIMEELTKMGAKQGLW